MGGLAFFSTEYKKRAPNQPNSNPTATPHPPEQPQSSPRAAQSSPRAARSRPEATQSRPKEIQNSSFLRREFGGEYWLPLAAVGLLLGSLCPGFLGCGVRLASSCVCLFGGPGLALFSTEFGALGCLGLFLRDLALFSTEFAAWGCFGWSGLLFDGIQKTGPEPTQQQPNSNPTPAGAAPEQPQSGPEQPQSRPEQARSNPEQAKTNPKQLFLAAGIRG